MYTPFAFIKRASTGTTVYEIYLSEPGGDLRVCALRAALGPYYTTDDTFQLTSVIYEDTGLQTPFDGGSAYFSVFDANSDPYGVYIQISGQGAIKDTGICK